MNRVLLAGATGYLGGYIAKELLGRSYPFKVLVRNPERLIEKNIEVTEIVQAEITKPESIQNCCEDIDVVISTVGITTQKDGLTYMDVDFQGNMNLLEEAKKSGVKKFIYISVLNGENLRHTALCNAKERFVEELKNSGLEYCVIRPNGFFSDISQFYGMADNGKIFLLDEGEYKVNPIHGEDLAAVCVDAIEKQDQEIKVGGPETLTYNKLAGLAFEVLGTKPKIVYFPRWVGSSLLKVAKLFMGSKSYGPMEFFLTVLGMDMVAPEHGKHTLKEYFTDMKEKDAEQIVEEQEEG
jgi:uncharacterized protein YbjT (DUF2867 family)